MTGAIGSASSERRLLARVAIKGASLFANKLLAALFLFFLGRRLGVDAFGQYGFFLAFAAFFSVILDFGMPLAAAREVCRGEEGIETVRDLLPFKLFLLPACTVLAVAGAAALGLRGMALAWTAIAVVATGIGSLLEYIYALFRGIGRVEVESIGSVAQKVIFVGLGVAGVLAGYGIHGAIAALLVSQAAVFAVASVAARRRFALRLRVPLRRQRERLRFVRTMAFPVLVGQAFSLAYFRIDIVMLKAFHGDAEVGIFSAPHKLIEGFHLLPAAVFAALFARLASLAGGPREELDRYAERLWATLWSLAVAGLAMGVGWADIAMAITFGERFSASAPPLRWLSAAIALMYPNYLLTQLLIIRGKVTAYATIAGICAAANIAANIFLIPRFGATGAAAATAGTEALLCGLAMAALGFPRARTAWTRWLPSAALAATSYAIALTLRPVNGYVAAALSLGCGIAAVALGRPFRSLRADAPDGCPGD
ncbi:MAG: oligosaccharide flippase family protein [Planctomycetes bacterium]|nr:oligosaccharide flippase family protein [Planctomycetota bacterium]